MGSLLGRRVETAWHRMQTINLIQLLSQKRRALCIESQSRVLQKQLSSSFVASASSLAADCAWPAFDKGAAAMAKAGELWNYRVAPANTAVLKRSEAKQQ